MKRFIKPAAALLVVLALGGIVFLQGKPKFEGEDINMYIKSFSFTNKQATDYIDQNLPVAASDLRASFLTDQLVLQGNFDKQTLTAMAKAVGVEIPFGLSILLNMLSGQVEAKLVFDLDMNPEGTLITLGLQKVSVSGHSILPQLLGNAAENKVAGLLNSALGFDGAARYDVQANPGYLEVERILG